LGHSLALEVVAEGVEDIETYDFLTQLGCDKAQGYYMCRPIEASKLSLWITEYNEALQSGESP
jgi:EAL domain-containing protein (putative c-di-GMP-specific phosphodiesterase class I)